MDAEIGIIGTGTMGAMTAWRLARRGVKVLAFEQFAPGHDQAGAGGESRIFRTAYREGVEYVPLLQQALGLWRELEKESGRHLLTVTGGLMIGAERSPAMRNVIASADRFGLEHEVLDPADMRRRYPQHVMLDGEIAVLDGAAGVLRPEFAVLAAAERAAAGGATILSDTTVERVEVDGTSVQIGAAGRTYTVRQLIIAAGSWSARLWPKLSEVVDARRLIMTWYAARMPRDFMPDAFPVFIRDSGVHLFGIPTLDGGSVKIAGAGENASVPDPDRLSRSVSPSELEAVNDGVARLLRGLTPTPVRVAVYTDAYTRDRHGLAGLAPGSDNVWLLTGFSGHGFKMASAIGEAMAQMVLGEDQTHTLGHLAPSRVLTSPGNVA